MNGRMLGHWCCWRRCVGECCGDPMRNASYARLLRRARRAHERDAWRRELNGGQA
jgi:hypothetical protein